jgi:enamine deaminase RidA (YjgF/YER057c/UK114 family)
MEIAFENVKAAFASVGASFENVSRFNNYIVDIGTNIAHYREVRDKYVNTAAPAASTTIGVPQTSAPRRRVRVRGDRGLAAEVTMSGFDRDRVPDKEGSRGPASELQQRLGGVLVRKSSPDYVPARVSQYTGAPQWRWVRLRNRDLTGRAEKRSPGSQHARLMLRVCCCL